MKVVGFFLTREGGNVEKPPWIKNYPLDVQTVQIYGWEVILWGHGDLSHFVTDGRIVVGYSDIELSHLSIEPLQNRGLVIELTQDGATVRNDAIGAMPVVYASADGMLYVSTCEESVIRAIGGVTLDEGLLVNFLTFQSAVGTLTFWPEIKKLYANSILRITNTGEASQVLQSPLEFERIHDDVVVSAMGRVLPETICRYTDQLDDVILPVSRGQDSRLIMCYMARPGRIHACTYPLSWPAERDSEVMIACRSAQLCGVADHTVVDNGGNYLEHVRSAVNYHGTLLGAIQLYLHNATDLIGNLGPWPVISGALGDILAGIGVNHVLNWLENETNPIVRFKRSCFCHTCEWAAIELDECLQYAWRDALTPLKQEWLRIWRQTEGYTNSRRADLIRMRNRGSQYIVYPWAALDLWGEMVTPYLDRAYIQFMLSLSDEMLNHRKTQKHLLRRRHSNIWPNAGYHQSRYCQDNVLNANTFTGNPEAFWPLSVDTMDLLPDVFRRDKIRTMLSRGIGGDKRAWVLLTSLQPIAWAYMRGYVK